MSFKSSSAQVPQSGGLQYHTRLKPGDIPPYVLVPGDPKRVVKIAQLWDKAEEVADYRQYHTMKGEYKGVKLACTSSGIGSPALAIAFDELLRVGVKTFIRVGTCGSLQAANVKNFEMEAGCLLTLASIYNVRAGAICVVVEDRVRDKFELTDAMEQKCAIVATEAVKILQR